jgi:hypothetical protein
MLVDFTVNQGLALKRSAMSSEMNKSNRSCVSLLSDEVLTVRMQPGQFQPDFDQNEEVKAM